MRWKNPAELAAHVRMIGFPRPSVDIEDQPTWSRPVSEVGLGHFQATPAHAAAVSAAMKTPQGDLLHHVPLDAVKRTVNSHVRLDALHHYASGGGDLFDPDGWYGTDHPVAMRHDDGSMTLADGTHRVAAARLRGDTSIRSHVVRVRGM